MDISNRVGNGAPATTIDGCSRSRPVRQKVSSWATRGRKSADGASLLVITFVTTVRWGADSTPWHQIVAFHTRTGPSVSVIDGFAHHCSEPTDRFTHCLIDVGQTQGCRTVDGGPKHLEHDHDCCEGARTLPRRRHLRLVAVACFSVPRRYENDQFHADHQIVPQCL